MEFKGIVSVSETKEDDVYIVNILMEFDDGEIEEIPFGLVPGDNTETSLVVREALDQWIVDGKSIIEYVSPTIEDKRTLMPSLTRRQFRLGMMELGVTGTAIESYIASIPDPMQREIATIEWQDASSFNRTHILVNNISSVLNLDPENIDRVWLKYMNL